MRLQISISCFLISLSLSPSSLSCFSPEIKMLFFLVSCLYFLLLSKSFLKPNPSPKMATFPWIFRAFFMFINQKRKFFIFPLLRKFSSPKTETFEETDHHEDKNDISLLELPDLALDSILEKLSPAELCSMAMVSTFLREKCSSDHLWQKLMREKWGAVIGESAYRQWQSQFTLKRAPKLTSQNSKLHLFSTLFDFFGLETKKMEKSRSSLSLKNSVMSCYLALESGKFWFPAQVFNRENGHIGFMLSCYDAQLSYGSTTDNFIARYKAEGRCMIEEEIEWKRIRAPSVDTPANVLHISDCLDELKSGDHIEIQWRKSKGFPYGWWYGVVGHMDSCIANAFNCRCHISDTVILEFKQFAPESRWRKTMISRKDHREVGNEEEGFYGGIRKLSKKEEIEKWQQLWPNCTLE